MSLIVIDVCLNVLVALLAFCLGSFYNVVIYRTPIGLSIYEPKRSFCPSCKKTILAWDNIPVISWLLLGGRCRFCGASISLRYPMVEGLTAIMLYGIYAIKKTNLEELYIWGPEVLAYWCFLSFLIICSFIDIDHYIIPLHITREGSILGALFSMWVPSLVEEVTPWKGLIVSGCSALGCAGLIWSIVEIGKFMLGRKKIDINGEVNWQISQSDESSNPELKVGSDTYSWDDMFNRSSDKLKLRCREVWVDEEYFEKMDLEIMHHTLYLNPIDKYNEEGLEKNAQQKVFDIEHIDQIKGVASAITVPREAMGFGDVLLIMLIASFCGWRGALFALFLGSILGSIMPILHSLLISKKLAQKIPFGPYLAVGATVWVFTEKKWFDWFFNLEWIADF
jgi:leader peptidase (prepilin peptidase)/N-methyltransferase